MASSQMFEPVLNMILVLNIPGFWIFQGSENGRFWMYNCSEYSSDSGYTWVLDMPLKTRWDYFFSESIRFVYSFRLDIFRNKISNFLLPLEGRGLWILIYSFLLLNMIFFFLFFFCSFLSLHFLVVFVVLHFRENIR